MAGKEAKPEVGTQKINLDAVQPRPEVKPEAKPAPKAEPPKPQGNPIEKKVKAILSRHKDLPFEVVEQIKKSKTAMEAKRRLKEHLQSTSPA